MGVIAMLVIRAARRSAFDAGVLAGQATASARAAAAAAPQLPPVSDAAAGREADAEAPDAGPPPPPVWRVASLSDDATVAYAQGEVGHRTMLAALEGAGLAKSEVFRLVRAFDGVKSLDHTSPKDTYAFAKTKDGAKDGGRLVAFEYATSPTDIWQARDKDGTLAASRLELNIEQKRVAVGVAVGDDLRASIVAAGLDDDMLKMLDDALDGHAELSDLQRGARLRILATEDRVDGAFVRYETLDAVEYVPANPSAPKLRVYWFASAPPAQGGPHARAVANGAYYDARGQQPYHGGWRSPVPLARIASRFNPHRMHPVLHIVMPHNGVDFAAPPGTPVYASAAGVVKSAGPAGPCGNMVEIQHATGLVSAYCHLSRFASGLHVGQHVESRQLIGYVGQTGRTTGPHLHFAIKRGEIFLDPLALKLDSVRVLPQGMRDAFAKERVDKDLALEAIPLPAALPPASEADAGADETVFDDSPGLE
jgi:murein DD-endopeptidase MepM/ murein hydrolase activator NlpD